MISDNAKLMILTDKNKLKITVYVNREPEYTKDTVNFPFPFPSMKIYEVVIDIPEDTVAAAIKVVDID